MIQAKAVMPILRVFLVMGILFGSTSIVQPDWLRAAPASSADSESKDPIIVNVNTASLEDLQQVRGVGPTIAE